MLGWVLGHLLRALWQLVDRHIDCSRAPMPRQYNRSKVTESFAPVVARTETHLKSLGPRVFDCVLFSFVRRGSAILDSSAMHSPVNVGDALVLAPNTLFTIHPEGSTTTTTLYVEVEYLIDQVLWRHANLLADRSEAWEFISTRFPESTRIFNIGVDRIGFIEPWIDRLVELSVDGALASRFFRMQADLASVLDVLDPYFECATRDVAMVTASPDAASGRRRTFGPIRHEALTMHTLLESSVAKHLTLNHLATAVHLSPSQAHRVFVDAYGHTPLAHQTHLRVDEMARLMRTTTLTIQEIGRRVGWRDRSHAARSFRCVMGVNPRQYRRDFQQRV